jgi:hypothetical protein
MFAIMPSETPTLEQLQIRNFLLRLDFLLNSLERSNRTEQYEAYISMLRLDMEVTARLFKLDDSWKHC